jgi:sugar lactone lactonase YvrE
LWAPRGIAIDRDGTILVVDAGTHRIRRYTPDGAHIADFGVRGKDPGDFDEPTGIAIGPDGSIYVADSRNARIQKFAPGFALVTGIWPIEDWADLNPRTKPLLEVLPDGRLIATDPAHSRLLLLNQDGRVTVRLETALDIPLFSPNGVSFDANRRFVYVTDGLAGHIRRFPFTDFALR